MPHLLLHQVINQFHSKNLGNLVKGDLTVEDLHYFVTTVRGQDTPFIDVTSYMGFHLDKVHLRIGEEGFMHIHKLERLTILRLILSNKRSLLMKHNRLSTHQAYNLSTYQA